MTDMLTPTLAYTNSLGTKDYVVVVVVVAATDMLTASVLLPCIQNDDRNKIIIKWLQISSRGLHVLDLPA